MRPAIRRENKCKQKITHQTSLAALLFRWLIWALGQNRKRRIWMPDPVNFGVCFPETRSFCSWWDLWAITAGRWRVWCNRPGGGAPKELVPEFHPSGLWKHVLSHPRDDWPCCVVSSRGQQRGPAGQQASSVCVCSVCVCVCVCVYVRACVCVCARARASGLCHSVVSDSFVTSWTVAHQAPLSMGFSRQEYWSGLPFPPRENLSDPGTKPVSRALEGKFFTSEPPGKP